MGAAPLIDFRAPWLWRMSDIGAGLTCWLRGTIFDGKLATPPGNPRTAADEQLTKALRATDGLFAAVVEDGSRALLAVDRVRSIPLFYGWDGAQWRISDNGGALALTLGLNEHDINPDGALALAMAGYTIGEDTLFRSLKSLTAGQAVILGPGMAERRVTYDRYCAWEVEDRPDDVLEATLAETTLGILDKMIRSAGGRTFVIPLSAGNDSRLIASGLRHLGYKYVRCFSYGIPGNHEAEAARRIAGRLGYPWRFVPYSPEAMRRFFASDDHAAYLQFADTCTGAPFEQDLPAIRALQKDGYIPPDGILVNGNTGDFISGNHVLRPFRKPTFQLSAHQRRDLVLDTLIGKHFRLWQALATPEHDARIRTRLARELDATRASFDDPGTVHGIYEFAEFQDRQSKYVITGQRIYEYAGHEWRLPLWDCDYLNFWRTVPLRAKAGQNLYKTMLRRQNWGGVWQGSEWHFPQNIVPGWLRWCRLAFRAMHAPFGADTWHRFEKRYLGYWMSNLMGGAIHPYWRIATDRRGARHGVAWLTEAYLLEKKLGYDGRPLR